MRLVRLPRFYDELDTIVSFIAEDSVDQAIVFFDAIFEAIHEIPSRPYSYRRREQSKYPQSREMIFKGYCVPFYIDEEENTIVILGIYNQNIWEE